MSMNPTARDAQRRVEHPGQNHKIAKEGR